MKRYSSIVILTGAGVSAESGLGTFRGPDGLWNGTDYREVSTPSGFARNPSKVHDFYNMRRRNGVKAQANAAHVALARLEQEFDSDFLLITQNVDRLHEQAGSKKLLHMHGDLGKARCTACGDEHEWLTDLLVETACPSCQQKGAMRPAIVWFTEMPLYLDEIGEALKKCDLFISIGTSGNVYPAANFVAEARKHHAITMELNLEPSEGATFFDNVRYGKATEIVPAFVDEFLAKHSS
jgi:NAD-dependent deacetylase